MNCFRLTRSLQAVARSGSLLGASSWLLALLVVSAGCDRTTSQTASSQTASPAVSAATPEAQAAVRETWDSLHIEGSKVGHGSTRVSTIERNGKELLKTEQVQEMSVQRGGQTTRMRISLTSFETPAGELREFEARSELGPTPTIAQGIVGSGKLVIKTTAGGPPETTAIEFPPGTGGFHAVEQSLERQPMKAGEKRSLTALLPVMNTVARVDMTAAGVESVSLADRTQELLRVDTVTVTAQGVKLPSTYWVTKDGEPLKMFTPIMNMETYRTTKAIATSDSPANPFDLLDDAIVKVDRPIQRPFETQHGRYQVQLKTGNPGELFSSGVSQQVRHLDEHSAELVISAVRPDEPLEDNVGAEFPGEEALQPNSLIQSDNALIKRMSGEFASEESEAWPIALAAEKFVYEAIDEKGFTQALASAADVAQTREGDCTEHAVLLAALLRAREIPAQVATGLVYSAAHQGFAYHMWTEAWVNDRWVPLDATLGRGGIGATHLKISDSTLKAASAFDLSLQVAQVIGQLEIKVLEVN